MGFIQKEDAAVCLLEQPLFLFGTGVSTFHGAENFHGGDVWVGELGAVDFNKWRVFADDADLFGVVINEVCQHGFAGARFPCDDGVTGTAQRAYDFFRLLVDVLHGAHVDNVLEIGFRLCQTYLHFQMFDFAVELVNLLDVLKYGICAHKFPVHKNRIGIDHIFIGGHQMDFFIQNGTMIF